MVQQRVLAVLYSILLISCLSDNLVYTVNGYRDERDNIIQRRPTVRTVDDNFIIETPRNRNITLSPGEGGFVRIGNTVIDPNQPYQNINQQSQIQVNTGPPGPQGPPGPKGDPGSADTAADIVKKLKLAGIDLDSLVKEVKTLREEVHELEKYSLKGTFPALFEFFNNKYGVRYKSDIKYGRSGLMVMTQNGGTLFGQHIKANGLDSGTTYAITFYLTSLSSTPRNIDAMVAGSDQTELYINDKLAIKCGDGDATFASCNLRIPGGNFKLTLVCSDTQDVLESIGFQANWLNYNQLQIDWTSLNKAWRNSSDKRRKK